MSSSHLPAPPGFEIYPATLSRWDDLERLLGPDGAYKGCWCAYWRLRQKDFKATREQQRYDRPRCFILYPSNSEMTS